MEIRETFEEIRSLEDHLQEVQQELRSKRMVLIQQLVEKRWFHCFSVNRGVLTRTLYQENERKRGK